MRTVLVVLHHWGVCYLLPRISAFNNQDKHLEIFFLTVSNLEVSNKETPTYTWIQILTSLCFGHKILISKTTHYSFCWKYPRYTLIIIFTHHICENLLYNLLFPFNRHLTTLLNKCVHAEWDFIYMLCTHEFPRIIGNSYLHKQAHLAHTHCCEKVCLQSKNNNLSLYSIIN